MKVVFTKEGSKERGEIKKETGVRGGKAKKMGQKKRTRGKNNPKNLPVAKL